MLSTVLINGLVFDSKNLPDLRLVVPNLCSTTKPILGSHYFHWEIKSMERAWGVLANEILSKALNIPIVATSGLLMVDVIVTTLICDCTL